MRRSTPAVDGKVEPPAHRLSAGFEAALKSFFNQCPERGAFLLRDTADLPNQLVGDLCENEASRLYGDPYRQASRMARTSLRRCADAFSTNLAFRLEKSTDLICSTMM